MSNAVVLWNVFIGWTFHRKTLSTCWFWIYSFFSLPKNWKRKISKRKHEEMALIFQKLANLLFPILVQRKGFTDLESACWECFSMNVSSNNVISLSFSVSARTINVLLGFLFSINLLIWITIETRHNHLLTLSPRSSIVNCVKTHFFTLNHRWARRFIVVWMKIKRKTYLVMRLSFVTQLFPSLL